MQYNRNANNPKYFSAGKIHVCRSTLLLFPYSLLHLKKTLIPTKENVLNITPIDERIRSDQENKNKIVLRRHLVACAPICDFYWNL